MRCNASVLSRPTVCQVLAQEFAFNPHNLEAPEMKALAQGHSAGWVESGFKPDQSDSKAGTASTWAKAQNQTCSGAVSQEEQKTVQTSLETALGPHGRCSWRESGAKSMSPGELNIRASPVPSGLLSGHGSQPLCAHCPAP